MKFREYLHSRLGDPVGWFALAVIGTWGVSAGFGVPPFQVLNAICVLFSAAEWWSLFSWWRTRRRVSSDVVEELTPALDRWKVGVLIFIGSMTLILELWVGSSSPTPAGWGLSVLGISSLITLWHAWSRPIVVTGEGLLVGIQTVRWSEIRRMVLDQSRFARIEFSHSNYFYGNKLRVALNPAQVTSLNRIVPDSVRPTSDEQPIQRITV